MEGASVMVRIVLAEPAELIRKAIRGILPQDFQIISEVYTLETALRAVADGRPDVVVASYSWPRYDGPTFVSDLVESQPRLMILLLSDRESPQLLGEAVKRGVAGIVQKTQPLDVISAAIEAVGRGGYYLCPGSSASLANVIRGNGPAMHISQRESDVLRLIANGLQSKSIANVLGLAHCTVRTYRKTLMRKMGASNVAELMAAAASAGLL